MNYLRMFRRPIPSLCKICSPTSPRLVSQHPSKFLDIQDRWRHKDGIGKQWQLIYKAPMENMLNYTSGYLTISTATIMGAAAYYAAFLMDPTDLDTPVILGDNIVIADSVIEYFTYIGAFVAFHAAVKVLLSKYVVRLYQNGDNYIAVFRGHFFNSIRKHKFHLNEFKKLKPTLVVTWGDARYGLGDKHGIILENYFKTPEYFNYLLYKKKADDSSMDN